MAGLGVVSPILNRGVFSNWLEALPGSTQMVVVDTVGNVSTQAIPSGASWGSITGSINAQADLIALLNAKADSSHTHTISNVTGLQAALDAKASTSHSHAISDVTNLQSSLDAKANSSHTHTIANVTNLQSSLDAKASLNTSVNFAGVTLPSDTGFLTIVRAAFDNAVMINPGSSKYWNSHQFGWTSGSNANSSIDTLLVRDAAGILGLRGSSHGLRVYGTYTDGSNYRRLAITSTTAGAFSVTAEGAGTGVNGNYITFPLGIRVGSPGAGSSISGYLGSTWSDWYALCPNAYVIPGVGWRYLGNGFAGLIAFESGKWKIVTCPSNASGADASLATFNERLVINAATGLIGIGGDTVASVPALKRSSTTVQFRLGDDSADCPISASNLTLSGNLIESTPTTPASASATGTTGTITWDTNFVYVCTATNTWKRAAISTW